MLVERIALKAGIFLAGQHYYTSSGPQTKLPRVAEEISTCDDGCTAKDFEQHGALQWMQEEFLSSLQGQYNYHACMGESH